jgi:DNA repair exonuclease SbcCD nuclease subunit
MKILHTSDWHADWRTAGVERYDEIERAVDQTVRAAIDEKVDRYVFTGDLCDPEDGPAALRAVSLAIGTAKRLADAKIQSWWVAGNHDVFEDGSGRTTLTPLRALDGGILVQVFEEYTFCDMGPDIGCVALPFISAVNSDDVCKVLRVARPRLRKKTVVLSHLGVRGIIPGDETTEMPRGRDIYLPIEEIDPCWLVLQGHYHQAQTHVVDGRTIHVAGSLARLTFGEEGHSPSYQIVTV